MTIEVQLLGHVGIRRSGSTVTLGGTKQRLLLAILGAERGRVVSSDRLCEALWGNDQPATAIPTLQSHVSRLRTSLAPDVRIDAVPTGYSLVAAADVVDIDRFVAALDALDGCSDPSVVRDHLANALACWTGPAFGEFADHEWLRARGANLDELRLAATERWVDARAAVGADIGLVGELEQLVIDHPLRERFWRQLMLALHQSGRQGEALRRAEELRVIVRDELGLEPSPEIHDLEAQILANDPRLRPTSAGLHQSMPGRGVIDLPSRLLGREKDLDNLRTLIASDRIVTLVGTGGVGKTRLARRLASDNHGFPEPAVFVELAVLRESDDIMARLATALDVQQRQHRSIEETLIDVLREHHRLVVLDNCEHVIEQVAAFGRRLTSECPRLHLLMTSREPVGIPGEAVSLVAPLTIGSGAAGSPAVELFIERAASARSGFAATPELMPVIAELCRRLDGLPLAIELAAVRLRSLSPAGIIERLDHRFELLSGGARASDLRHQSLQNMVEWSYLLLMPPEQRLFVALSVFSGSFNLPAVQAICADGDSDVAGLLFSLVDKSMVQVIDFDEPRYHLLETLREFAHMHLTARGVSDVQYDRHRTWFLDLCEGAAEGLDGPDERVWSMRIERDFDNLRAIHSRSVECGDVDTSVRLVVALTEYAIRRMRSELTSWALATAAMTGAADHPGFPAVLATVAYGLFVRGDLPAAIDVANDSTSAAERLGVPSSGLAERTLANARFYLGEVDEGQRWMETMISLARADGDAARLAHAFYMRSVAETTLGRTARGAALAEESRAFALSSGAPSALSQSAYAIGMAQEATDPDAATAQLLKAVHFAIDGGNRWIEAFARTAVLWQQARRGGTLDALSGFAPVIESWYRGGDWANQWLSLRFVGNILQHVGDHEAAALVRGALGRAGATSALPVGPAAAEELDADARVLREVLGADAFDATTRRGAELPDSSLIAYLLARIAELTQPSLRACDP
jgi:predicted ATPase/DNA-binding SARP family transcriptional activator